MKRFLIAALALMTPVAVAAQAANEPYTPGLGEFMIATQLRHAKLWFAGQSKNWASLIMRLGGEIKEGLEDAAKYDPMHDGLPIPDMIKGAPDAPLEALQKAVDAKNSAQFATAFDSLTKGCNACHASAKKVFIKIQRPTAPPATNQVFRP